MKQLVISGFKTKEQYRILFINFLKEYGNLGLKQSKILLDEMIDGKSIQSDLHENRMRDAEFILKKLKMNYTFSR